MANRVPQLYISYMPVLARQEGQTQDPSKNSLEWQRCHPQQLLTRPDEAACRGELCVTPQKGSYMSWPTQQLPPTPYSLTCHLQHHSCAAVILDPDKAREAPLIGNPHTPQQQGDVAQGQLVMEEGRAVGIAAPLVGQLVLPLSKAVHQPLGIRQLPDETKVSQAEIGVRRKRTVQGGIVAKKGNHRIVRDSDFHST